MNKNATDPLDQAVGLWKRDSFTWSILSLCALLFATMTLFLGTGLAAGCLLTLAIGVTAGRLKKLETSHLTMGLTRAREKLFFGLLTWFPLCLLLFLIAWIPGIGNLLAALLGSIIWSLFSLLFYQKLVGGLSLTNALGQLRNQLPQSRNLAALIVLVLTAPPVFLLLGPFWPIAFLLAPLHCLLAASLSRE